MIFRIRIQMHLKGYLMEKNLTHQIKSKVKGDQNFAVGYIIGVNGKFIQLIQKNLYLNAIKNQIPVISVLQKLKHQVQPAILLAILDESTNWLIILPVEPDVSIFAVHLSPVSDF